MVGSNNPIIKGEPLINVTSFMAQLLDLFALGGSLGKLEMMKSCPVGQMLVCEVPTTCASSLSNSVSSEVDTMKGDHQVGFEKFLPTLDILPGLKSNMCGHLCCLWG